MSSETLVIIPTYNESLTIKRLIDTLISLPERVDVLIIDDNSPDGTAELVQKLVDSLPDRIHLIRRPGKQGLGTAYVQGFKYALENNYSYVCEMDADFSHDPQELTKLIRTVRQGEADIAIGSRYCDGISIINWPLSRLILSYTANLYARFITGLPVADTTAGFKCIRKEVLEDIALDRIKANGYAFQIELHFRAWKAGYRLKEVSIIFYEREQGQSKMSKDIVREAVWRVWVLKFRSLFNKL